MGKTRDLDIATRASIQTLKNEGYTCRLIAERLNQQSTILFDVLI